MFFLHVQKCGGTSIKQALRAGFPLVRPRDEVLDLDAAASTRIASRLDLNNFEFRDQLLSYHLESAYPRVIMGHFRFTAALHERYLDDVAFVTVLRRPADRFLSAYFYDRYKANEYGRIEESLETFLLHDGEPTLRARVHAEKYAALFRGDGTKDARRASADDVAAAIENLKRFAVVGFLEELEPFVTQLDEWADTPLDIPVLNTTPASATQRDEVTPELLSVIEDICAPSTQIYDALRTHTLG